MFWLEPGVNLSRSLSQATPEAARLLQQYEHVGKTPPGTRPHSGNSVKAEQTFTPGQNLLRGTASRARGCHETADCSMCGYSEV